MLHICLQIENNLNYTLITNRTCGCDTKSKIFLLGFPKCGTLSFHYLLNRISGCNSLHYVCPIIYCKNNTLNKLKNSSLNYEEFRLNNIGYLMELAYNNSKPLLYYMPNKYNVFTQMDVCNRAICIWPQIKWYKLLYKQYPNSLFILPYRNIGKHITSINNWNNMREIFINCDIPGLSKNIGIKDNELKLWMLSHYSDVEKFFSKYEPQIFIKFDIEKDNISKEDEQL